MKNITGISPCANFILHKTCEIQDRQFQTEMMKHYRDYIRAFSM